MEENRQKNRLEKWLLSISILIGVFGILLLVIATSFESHSNKLVMEFNDQIDKLSSSGQLDNDTIPDSLKEKAKRLVEDRYSGVQSVGFKFNNIGQSNLDGKYLFTYPPHVALNEYGTLQTNVTKRFVNSIQGGLTERIRDTDRQFLADKVLQKFAPGYHQLTIILLAGYWLMFSFWALLRIYSNRDFHLKWFFLIIFLNVLGYWLYTEKRLQRKLVAMSSILYLLGAWVVYNGIQILTTPTRGTFVMYKMGVPIELTNFHVYVDGSIFLVIGVLLFVAPTTSKRFLQKLLLS